VLLALVAVVPAFIVLVGTQLELRRHAREEALDEYWRLARLAAAQQATTLGAMVDLLDTVGRVPSVRLERQDECQDFLASVFPRSRNYRNLIVFDPDGSITCSANRLVPTEPVRQKAEFQRALATGRTTLSKALVSSVDGVRLVVVIHPALDVTGHVEHLIAAGVSLDELNRQLSAAALPPGVTLALIDDQANLLSSYPDDLRDLASPIARDTAWLSRSQQQVLDAPGADGRARLWLTVPVRADFETGLLVTMSLEPAVAFAATTKLFWWQMGLLAFVTALVVGAGLVGGGLFVLRPVRTLKDVLDRLAAGDLEARAQLASGVPGLNEIGESVDSMAAALAERTRALVASEQRYRYLFEGHAHPLFIYDPQTLVFLAVNQAAVDQYGYSREVLSTLTLSDLHVEKDRPAVQANYSGQLRRSLHTWRHRTQDGRLLDVDLCVTPVPWNGGQACLLSAEDVTERTRLESELRQAQKLKALGQLAGGVAHDFNNLLTAILGYANLVAEALPRDDASQADVAEVIGAANRAASLTRQLLAFSRKQILAPHVLKLGDHVRDVAPMLTRLLGETIRLTITTAENGFVRADPNQMTQVIMNLAVNARDAMPGGGELHIETADRMLASDEGEADKLVPSGPYVALVVRDTGYGMDAPTLDRAFEPFFTTKPLGQGTGLGLATVHGIVKQSGGHILAESAVGQGTTFTVLLPCTDEEAHTPHIQEGAPATKHPATILVVEDEEAVRAFVTTLLQRAGHVVHSVAHPAAAIELAGRCQDSIDVLLTDVVMPGMTGNEVALLVKKSHPEAQVLYMSGYAEKGIVRHGVLDRNTRLLPKPFTAEVLFEKLNDVLAVARPAASPVPASAP